MAKPRAYGADATLKARRETTYGLAPTSGYRSLDFKSTDLSSTQPLGEDPLLGRGRNAQDPYRGLISDEGQIEIPLDLRGTGFWLTALFGDPDTTAVAASGAMTFTDLPEPGDTLTMGGTPWTFVEDTPGANETVLQATPAATVDQLAQDLAASSDEQIAQCSIMAVGNILTLTFDTPGPSGNSFTLATTVATATLSAPTLTGGGYAHVWTSGADVIPSLTIEIGHPKLTTPVFFRHLGTVLDSLSFDMGQEGPANARLSVVAQGEEHHASTLDPSPTPFALRRFSQGRGFIHRNGVPLAGVTSGSLTFSNTLERVRVIREDGKIEAAEPTFASAEGTMTVRFDGTTLVSEAANGDPVSLEYGFTLADGYSLTFALPRVFLPKPKYAITGPAGVEARFDWRAAFDDSEGTMLSARLLNDVPSYL